MGKKKLQGADGMNFQLQLTIKGLESINLPEENLTNESGNDIMKISCWGGKLSAYVNLPNAIRPNNVQPFQLSDCIKIELVRNQVIEHMRSYLQKHLKDKYSDEFLSMMSVTKMECNLTIKCVGDCKPKDVIRLFERSFAKVTVYKETDPNGKTHRKPERGITTTKPHEWVLKVYDKTFQQRQAGNLKVESNLIRVELVFLDRMLDRMYSSKKSLEDILTRKAIKTLIDQYQETFDEICKKNITPMLNKRVDKNMVNEIYDKLQSKLQDMVAENAFVYDRMNNRVEEIRNRGYDYANEQDDTQAVQSKALQLMSQMPKVMNSNHANRITKVLTDSINSGVIGSKAVLELLKYSCP